MSIFSINNFQKETRIKINVKNKILFNKNKLQKFQLAEKFEMQNRTNSRTSLVVSLPRGFIENKLENAFCFESNILQIQIFDKQRWHCF